MTLRALLEKFFLLCGVLALILLVAGADAFSYAILIPLGVALWALYIYMEWRAHKNAKNRPAVYVKANGRWVAMDGSGRSFEGNTPPKNSLTIYDQDADQ